MPREKSKSTLTSSVDVIEQELLGTHEHSPGTRPAQPDTEGTREPEMSEMVEENSDPKKRVRSFFFTINNPKMTPEELEEYMRNEKAKALVFQKEVGEEGTPHYQGFVRFKNPRLYGPLATALNGTFFICKNEMASRRYCSKKRSRISGPYGFGCDEAKEMPDILRDDQLYDWQKEIIEKIKGEVDPRGVIWRWSNKGGVGKSEFSLYLQVKYGAYEFGGKAGDIKAALADMVEAGKKIPPIIIWDVPRSNEKFVSYQALEEIKNGHFFSGKFHGTRVWYKKRHVIVFANFPPPPNDEAMSRDRFEDTVCLDDAIGPGFARTQ